MVFCDWRPSLSITFSRSFHLIACIIIVYFSFWIIFHCKDIPQQLVDICGFYFFGIMNNMKMNYFCTSFYIVIFFNSLRIIPRRETAGLYRNSVKLFEELSNCFSKVVLPVKNLTKYEGSTFSTSSSCQHLLLSLLFSHPSRGLMISHHGCVLHCLQD